MKLRLNSAKAEAQASSLSLAELGKIQSYDQPWISQKLKKMDRKRKRIYGKERRSENWSKLNKIFKKEIKSAKANFHKSTVADLKLEKTWPVVFLLKQNFFI